MSITYFLRFSQHSKGALFLLAPCALFLLSTHSLAAGFGVFESRAQGMAGASVAVGTPEQAAFYNPALLAFSDGKEEDTRNGRILLPSALIRGTTNLSKLQNAIEDDLDEQLIRSVDDFNDNNSIDNAIQVLNAARDIESTIEDIGNDEVDVEAVIGFTISEPGHREGGSFYFASRILAFGVTQVSDDDLTLLGDYIDAMDISINSSIADAIIAHPDLFDENSILIDPSEDITSTADVGSIVIAEWGVAAAKEFTLFDFPFAVGITPKVQRLKVFREDISYTDTDLQYVDTVRTFLTMNVDLGLAATIWDDFRLGLTIKDVLPQEFDVDNGLNAQIQPKIRFGSAYYHRYLSIGFDLDLISNRAIAGESPIQEASVGIEVKPFDALMFRFGYRHELFGIHEGALTTGVGIKIGRAIADFSYLTGSDQRGGAVQFGLAF